MRALLFDFKFPDFNLLHLNWQAFGVLLSKYRDISFQPKFFISFKCLSSMSSWVSQDVGFFAEVIRACMSERKLKGYWLFNEVLKIGFGWII